MPNETIPVDLCQCGCGEKTSLSRDNDATRNYVKGRPHRFAAGHQGREHIRSLEERFWGKVEKTGSCWLWTAAVMGTGYGAIASGDGKVLYAHRVAYELLVGPIPDGLHIDHLCRNPPCVNPAHLEPVTPAENFRRGAGSGGVLHVPITHCQRAGHEYTPENSYITPSGQRFCRACRNADSNRRYHRKRKEQKAKEKENG